MKAHVFQQQQTNSIRTAGDEPIDYLQDDRDLDLQDRNMATNNGFYIGNPRPISHNQNPNYTHQQSSLPAQENPYINENNYDQQNNYSQDNANLGKNNPIYFYSNFSF